MKNAVVIGVAGFIGSNIAKKLVKDGCNVLGVDNFYSGTFKNIIDFKGEFACIDVAKDSLDRFAGADALFFESAITDTTVMNQEEMMINNYEAFRRVLEFSKDKHIKIVYASSAATYGNAKAPTKEDIHLVPLNVYGYSKLCMDRLAAQYAEKYNMDIVGLRYFNVYGMGEQHKGKFASMIYQLAQQMRSGKHPQIFTDGEQKRDFVSIDDAVSANMKAVFAKSGVYNVGSGASTTFNEIVEYLNEGMGLDLAPRYFECPYDFFQVHTEADLTKSKNELGYEPEVSIKDGILDYLNKLGFAK